MNAFYIGYFNGNFNFKEGEMTGMIVRSLEDLQKEIQSNPELFTGDLKFMVEKYQEYLVPLEK